MRRWNWSDALRPPGSLRRRATVVAQRFDFFLPSPTAGRMPLMQPELPTLPRPCFLKKGPDATHPMTSFGSRSVRTENCMTPPPKPRNEFPLPSSRVAAAAVCPVQAIDPAQPRLTDKTAACPARPVSKSSGLVRGQFPPAIYYPARACFPAEDETLPSKPEWVSVEARAAEVQAIKRKSWESGKTNSKM